MIDFREKQKKGWCLFNRTIDRRSKYFDKDIPRQNSS